MKKISIYIIFLMIFVNLALAETAIRDLPPSVGAGEAFNIRYEVIGMPDIFYGIVFDDEITGGCLNINNEPKVSTFFMHEEGMLEHYKDITLKAPLSAGTCTFTGNYQFGNPEDEGGVLPEVNFPTQTITITGEVCAPSVTCESAGYECGSVDNGCGIMISCPSCASGETCNGGTCIDVTDPCSECTAWIDVTCVGTAMKQVRTCPSACTDDEEQFVASATCEATTPTPSGCEIWEQSSDTGCQTAGWVFLAVGIIGLMAFLKFM